MVCNELIAKGQTCHPHLLLEFQLVTPPTKSAVVAAEVASLSKGAFMRQYSPFFQTLHDEKRPVGHLGRGTHYSVLRCVTWHNQSLEPLKKAAFHDFAIIWDEDHDERIIHVIEDLYFQGLLAPALFVGERKGSFTLLTTDSFAQELGQSSFKAYVASVGESAQPEEDYWPTHIHSFSQSEGYIINDSPERVALYLNNLLQLWLLGINPI